MKAKKFNKLTDREKWDAFWDKSIKLKGTWHCPDCGEKVGGEPFRAEPFAGVSIHCGECDGMLTERTGGGQNDPFNWVLKKKKTRLEKFRVCDRCHCVGIQDPNCYCSDSKYGIIELEFEVCKCCGEVLTDGCPADTEFNTKQLIK